MKTIVFLIEEKSVAEMLKVIIRKINPLDDSIEFKYITFEGKQDLEKNIEIKIKSWLLPDTHFVIIRDQDSEDCFELKERLLAKCKNANRPETLVRIACHELENFYLGDLEAIGRAYNVPVPIQRSKKYRNPDLLSNAVQEIERITENKYQKISGARLISQYMKVDGTNVSTSFNVLLSGIRRIINQSE